MSLDLSQVLLGGNRTQPALAARDLQLVSQLLSDFLHLILDIKVPTQEFTDLCVFVVALKLLGGMAIRSVYVHVNSTMAVSTPACLTTLADNIGKCPGGVDRVLNQVFDLFRGDVLDSQVVVDKLGEIFAEVGLGRLG